MEYKENWSSASAFPGKFRPEVGGRVAAMSGAGKSPRERLSVGTDHPDSDEHNTREQVDAYQGNREVV